jgi:hypothetical protein
MPDSPALSDDRIKLIPKPTPFRPLPFLFGRRSDRDLQKQVGHATFSTAQWYIKHAEIHQKRVDRRIPARVVESKANVSVYGVQAFKWHYQE